MCCLRLTNIKHSKNYFIRETTENEATVITLITKKQNLSIKEICEISF